MVNSLKSRSGDLTNINNELANQRAFRQQPPDNSELISRIKKYERLEKNKKENFDELKERVDMWEERFEKSQVDTVDSLKQKLEQQDGMISKM